MSTTKNTKTKRILITVHAAEHHKVRVAAVQRGVTASSLYEEGARLLLGVGGHAADATTKNGGAA